MTELDAATFEVLRHRLWAINDEAGRARIMGQIAELEMRRNIARETRLHFMHHD